MDGGRVDKGGGGSGNLGGRAIWNVLVYKLNTMYTNHFVHVGREEG